MMISGIGDDLIKLRLAISLEKTPGNQAHVESGIADVCDRCSYGNAERDRRKLDRHHSAEKRIYRVEFPLGCRRGI